jgi:serine/threonine protein kinase
MILFTNTKKQIQIEDSFFASGGQGNVYHLISPVYNPPMVAKLFHTDAKAKAVQSRIEYMVVNNPFENAQTKIKDAFVWPVDTLYDYAGNFKGFLMPLIKDSEPLWNLTISKGFSDANWNKFNITNHNSYNTRLKICYNAAQAVAELHNSNDYVIVDLKPQNIRLRNNGFVAFIDLDSIQMSSNGTLLFNAEAATDEYCPPEFHQGKVSLKSSEISPTWDYFAFGVLTYQLLFCIHPFTATHPQFTTQAELIQHGLFVHGRNRKQLRVVPPPHNNFNKLLSPDLKNLFIRCFDEGFYDPCKRPDVIEWKDTLLNEIHRYNNVPVTAGGNQPQTTKRKKSITIPNQINPTLVNLKSNAVINSISIRPGGVNIAVLSWNVSNAVSVEINGSAVGLNGNMQVPVISNTFNLVATDYQGLSVSQSLDLNLQLSIIQFKHQIYKGYIDLVWDVKGANHVTINQIQVSNSGIRKLPLALGKYTIVAGDNNGYIISQDTEISTVAFIKEFNVQLYRTNADLVWEVWNAKTIELDGIPIPSVGSKKISLVYNSYNFSVTDIFGNVTNQTQIVNVTPQIQRFDIVIGNYTAKVYWDILFAKKAYLDGIEVQLIGEQLIPLQNRTLNLEIIDFNDQVNTFSRDVIAPNYIGLMPVIKLNIAKELNSIIKMNDILILLNKTNRLNTNIVSINTSNIALNMPEKLNFNKVKLNTPIVMKTYISNKIKTERTNKKINLNSVLSRAAALAGIIIGIFK